MSFARTKALSTSLAICVATLGACKSTSKQTNSTREAEPIRVAAASDLAIAFREVGAAYEKKTGRKVDFTFGATGLLAKQVEEGAPFDVFAGANLSFVDEAIASGACDKETRTLYATGRLALWSKSGGAPKLEDLADPRFQKIAIANPDHAPYGKAAKEALQKAGIWDKIEKRIVYGENVQQTLQFAQTGNADVAIVALGLAMGTSEGNYAAIDPSLHAPLQQAMVVCHGQGGPRDRAKDFAAFVTGTEGRATLVKHGFTITP